MSLFKCVTHHLSIRFDARRPTYSRFAASPIDHLLSDPDEFSPAGRQAKLNLRALYR